MSTSGSSTIRSWVACETCSLGGTSVPGVMMVAAASMSPGVMTVGPGWWLSLLLSSSCPVLAVFPRRLLVLYVRGSVCRCVGRIGVSHLGVLPPTSSSVHWSISWSVSSVSCTLVDGSGSIHSVLSSFSILLLYRFDWRSRFGASFLRWFLVFGCPLDAAVRFFFSFFSSILMLQVSFFRSICW